MAISPNCKSNQIAKKSEQTYHAVTVDADIGAVRVAFGAVLHFVRELDDDGLLAVELQSVSSIARKCLLGGRFLPETTPGVLQGLLAPTDQSARPGWIVMRIPFEQLPAIRDIVERCALFCPEVARLLARLQIKDEGFVLKTSQLYLDGYKNGLIGESYLWDLLLLFLIGSKIQFLVGIYIDEHFS